jgi:D-threo-aldose 1-dehydrogenase
VMRMHRIGRTDVHVTEIGFGSAPIGNLYSETSDEVALSAIDAAWDAGVRYFDTAPHYGLGLAERRLGRALSCRPRSELVVSTKVGRLLVPNPAPTGSDLAAGGFAVADRLTRVRDYSADGVRRSIQASLERMGMDRFYIVLVHDPDDYVEQAISDAIPALIGLREQGVIGAVGVGMNQEQAPLRMVRETDLDVVMLAGRWTLADRSGEQLMDQCHHRGVSVLAAAPYNSGLLAQDWPRDGTYFNYAAAPADMLAHARALALLAARHGVTLPQLAMQFPARHPATAAVVVGMRSAVHVRSTVDRATRAVPPQAWAELDRARPDDTRRDSGFDAVQ